MDSVPVQPYAPFTSRLRAFTTQRWLHFRLGISAVLMLGVALRFGFLDWQPLWADEGYSIYFATESAARLLWLTAHDIHPPLYYLLLHFWLKGWTLSPETVRIFSVLLALPALGVGIALSHTLYAGRKRLLFIFLLLLALNPLYLYYSQEVRMYGLALTLSMTASLCCWQWVQGVKQGNAVGWLWAYVVTAALSLYTLYYLAFLLLAHLLWASWELRKVARLWLRFVLALALVGLLYLPWVIYTARILYVYVNAKIRSDQDVALGLGDYLVRHLWAFTSGHLPFPPLLTWLPWLAVGCGGALLLWGLLVARWRSSSNRHVAAQRMLWFCLALPLGIAFAINRYYPFFPVGGERLLLFLLPYFLLLLADALDELWVAERVGGWMNGCLLLSTLVVPAGVGLWGFYTVPRYQESDYRPLVQQLVQQGTDQDTVLATFPWEVGLWRTYAATVDKIEAGPHLQLLSDRSVAWGPAVATLLDQALARGMLWIPGLRSIGSTLPAAMDRYLAARAVNFEQRWVGVTTLAAWHRPLPLITQPQAVDWGDLQLVGSGVSTTTMAAANTPLLVGLAWQRLTTFPAYGVTLRLQKAGRTWAYRDYAAVGAYVTALEAEGQRTEGRGTEPVWEQVGLIVPAGLPLGEYQLMLGLVAANGALRRPQNWQDTGDALIPLATLTVTQPAAPLPAVRLPMQRALAQPVLTDGLALLGYTIADISEDRPLLAGTALAFTLFWQRQSPSDHDYQLYVSLLDGQGAGVAGWEGWPLPDYPPAQWPVAALVQTPIELVIPGSVASGSYRLFVGLLDPVMQAKTPGVVIDTVSVQQRQATFSPVQPSVRLPTPVQFGTHVQLLGYAFAQNGAQLDLTLYWQVMQPLLPPHQIFIHLDDAQGETLAQADDTPQTAAGPAPTGSWQPGEYLVTDHRLTSSALTKQSAAVGLVLRLGLYGPATNARLPVTVAGAPAGDAFVLPLP